MTKSLYLLVHSTGLLTNDKGLAKLSMGVIPRRSASCVDVPVSGPHNLGCLVGGGGGSAGPQDPLAHTPFQWALWWGLLDWGVRWCGGRECIYQLTVFSTATGMKHVCVWKKKSKFQSSFHYKTLCAMKLIIYPVIIHKVHCKS